MELEPGLNIGQGTPSIQPRAAEQGLIGGSVKVASVTETGHSSAIVANGRTIVEVL